MRRFARFVTVCTILKKLKRKKHPRRSVTFNSRVCSNFTESNTPLWVFSHFFSFRKRYRIAQRITNDIYCHVNLWLYSRDINIIVFFMFLYPHMTISVLIQMFIKMI